MAESALSWLIRASDRAASLGSPEQALDYATQALPLATSPSDRAALNDRAARSASSAGDAVAAWAHLEAACGDFRVLGDVASEARLLATVNRLDDRLSDLADRLRDVDGRLPESNRAERVLVLAALTFIAAHAHEVDAALDFSERALTLAQSFDDDDELATREAVAARGFATLMAGRHLEARLFMETGVAMARRTDSPLARARTLMHFGVFVVEDDPRASLEAMLESAALSDAAGMRPTQGLALANAAEGAVDLGEWDVAERALDEGALLAREDQTDDDGALMTRAMLRAHREDPVAAVLELDDIEKRRGHAWDMVMMRTWLLRVRSMCRYLAADAAGASQDAAASIATDPSGGNAAASLWMAVLAGCAVRDGAGISAALTATSGLRGHWTHLVRATALASIEALERGADASASMRSALAAWSAAELPLDHAFATLCSVYVLEPEAVPTADVERARAYLEGLRAVSLLRLFDAAPGGRAS